jgi:hypothetical protein
MRRGYCPESDTLGTVRNQRLSILTAALAFARLSPQMASLRTLHAWLDSWAGIRWIAAAMRAEHHALTLTRNADRWTAALRYVGPTQLPDAAPSGLATMPKPWKAVQRAAWTVARRRTA